MFWFKLLHKNSKIVPKLHIKSYSLKDCHKFLKKHIYKIFSVALFFVVLDIGMTDVSMADNPPNRKEKRQEKKALKRSLEGEIQISGCFALYPLMSRWAREFRNIYPRVKIDISAGGAGKGITDALNGVVDMGMISREINKTEIENGAFVIAVAKDAVVATINAKNPNIKTLKTNGLKPSTARRLWADGSIASWGEVLENERNESVHLYTRSDASGCSEKWAQWLGTSPERLNGTAIYSDPGMASVVQRDKLALGYNSIAYAYNLRNGKPHRGMEIVPIDFNENEKIDPKENFYNSVPEINKAVSEGKYPARELYIVCKGAPKSKLIRAFLFYILTDGQKFATSAGFIPLTKNETNKELKKL